MRTVRESNVVEPCFPPRSPDLDTLSMLQHVNMTFSKEGHLPGSAGCSLLLDFATAVRIAFSNVVLALSRKVSLGRHFFGVASAASQIAISSGSDFRFPARSVSISTTIRPMIKSIGRLRPMCRRNRSSLCFLTVYLSPRISGTSIGSGLTRMAFSLATTLFLQSS